MKNHFNPKLILKNWRGDDNKLHQYKYVQEAAKVVNDRVYLSEAGFERELYSDVIEIKSNIEVENKAAPVIRLLLSNPLTQLTSKQRNALIKFIIWQINRTPSKVFENNKLARGILENLANKKQKGYDLIKKDNDLNSLLEAITRHNPSISNMGLNASYSLMDSWRIYEDINKMQWRVINFENSSSDLITSDNPCFIHALGTPECLLALPLSPRAAFFAAQDLTYINHTASKPDRSHLAKTLNRTIAIQASKYIYATGIQHILLAKKYLLKRN